MLLIIGLMISGTLTLYPTHRTNQVIARLLSVRIRFRDSPSRIIGKSAALVC